MRAWFGGRATGVRFEAFAGGDAELGEDFVQVPFDGARADVQPGADVRVGKALAGESGDLLLLWGELIRCLDGPLAHLLARRYQFAAGALGEGLHPDRDEHGVGGAQLLARVDPAILPAQPLPVEQTRAGELRTQP